MPKLLIATNNPGKAAELRSLLAGCGWEILTLADIRAFFRLVRAQARASHP